MLQRSELLARLRAGLKMGLRRRYWVPVNAARSLARRLAGGSNSNYFDLENPVDLRGCPSL